MRHNGLWARWAPLLLCAPLLWGCGGSSPAVPGSSAAVYGRLSILAAFPAPSRGALSRTVHSRNQAGLPDGTQSLLISVTDPGSGTALAQSQIITAPPAGGSASAQFSQIRAGAVQIEADAYSNATATGSPLGTATQDVTVTAGANTPVTLGFVLTLNLITLTPPSITLTASNIQEPTASISAALTDAGGASLTGYPLIWSSSNSLVATVQVSPTDPTQATVTAVGAGSAVIEVREPQTGILADAPVTINAISPPPPVGP